MHFDFKHHEYILVLFYSLIFVCTQFDTVTFLTSSCCSWSLKAATSRRASRCRGEIHPINSCSCKRTRDPTTNMHVTCKANAVFEVVSASGYPQEGTHFGAEKCYLWMPTNHEHPLQSQGLRNLIWHASWHHHTSWVWAAEFVLLVQLADLQKQSSKKSNNTILNKVKNNYKMIQGCRWKLVTFVVKACFCWKIVGTPKM